MTNWSNRTVRGERPLGGDMIEELADIAQILRDFSAGALAKFPELAVPVPS